MMMPPSVPLRAARTPLSSCLTIDVRRIVKTGWTSGSIRCGASSVGYRRGYCGGAEQPTFEWSSGGEPHAVAVKLTATSPNYSGQRWWARCPRCDRRCGILQLDGRALGCRVCLGLAYESTRETVFAL